MRTDLTFLPRWEVLFDALSQTTGFHETPETRRNDKKVRLFEEAYHQLWPELNTESKYKSERNLQPWCLDDGLVLVAPAVLVCGEWVAGRVSACKHT